MFQELRAARESLGNFEANPDPFLCIYLGLYNAEPFLQQIEINLDRQELKVPILVVDNCSTDDTWDLIQPWLDRFQGRIRLVRNSVNLGGLGSLLQNFDLIPSEWFITMHQDDQYFSNHVEVLEAAARSARTDVDCIATEMGSLDATGTSNGLLSPPRAAWALPDRSRQTLFLSNLKLHSVPFPAASFRTSAFRHYCGPWHSTSFPDTEWVLRCLLRSEIELLPIKTMDYRENPQSESHTVTTNEAQVGASLALSRVFSNDAFVDFARSVETPDRQAFAQSVFSGIAARLAGSESTGFVTAMAAEQLGQAFGYEVASVNSQILQGYGSTRPKNMAILLQTLGGAGSALAPQHPGLPHKEGVAADLLNSPSTTGVRRKSGTTVQMLLVVLNLLPLPIRRRAFRALVNSRLVPNDSVWKARWRG